MRHPLLTLLVILTGPAALAAGEPQAEPLVDLAAATQNVDERHFRARLRLEGLFAHKGKPVACDAILSWVDGSLARREAVEDRWRGLSHPVEDATDLAIRDDALLGTLVLAGGEDAEPRAITIATGLTPVEGPETPKGRALEGRWWRIMAASQGRVATLEGTWSEGDREGRVSGTIELPLAPGRFDMGEAVDGGVAFLFDMGTARQNWNHARLAQVRLRDEVRDLTDGRGLAVSVATDAPRIDASVTVWIQEGDGSWYYVKDAVPLAAEENRALLLWEDFEEAEWVAPSNHMDEDYAIDLRAVKTIGVGVVNPLGVGEVSFTLTGLGLAPTVKAPGAVPPTARLRVTGKTLDVNGQEVVPAALIGGYHPYLPQKYRPGCQRDLHFGITGSPSIPRRDHARLGRDDILDAQALIAALAGDEVPPALARAKVHFEAKFLERRLAKWAKREPENDKDARKRAEGLAKVLNRALDRRDFYDAEAYIDVSLGDELRARVAELEAMNTVELVELNRDLLHRAAPDLITPRPPRPTEQFIVDCQGERLHPALYLASDDWKGILQRTGESYARKAAAAEHLAVMEFWNEPYLNWAERSRKNFDVEFYRQDLAVEGGPVHVKRGDGREDIVPHFKWVKARDDRVSQTDSGLMVIDETAFSYWSGRGNGYIYDTMYRVHAGAIKEANPDVLCIAGWGFRWHEDHWAAWEMLYKPTIDENIDLIDGVHEHHYQGDTTDMVGSYEVLTAYGVTAHDKWLRCYNTETNDLVDAPARGNVNVPDNVASKNTKNYRRAIYNLRDILYCVHQAPGKAASRTMIHADHAWHGTDVCFGFLADLRGRLVHTEAEDPELWTVASIDGTDPSAPAPHDGKRLCVIVFNEHRHPRTFHLEIAAPAGTTFSGAGSEERVVRNEKTWNVEWTKVPMEETIEPRVHRVASSLPGRSAFKVLLHLEGDPVDAPEVVRRQHFAPDILQTVLPGEDFATAVAIDPDELAGAEAARLRLVVENLAPGEGVVHVGERTIELPRAYTRDNGNRIVEFPLEVDELAEEIPIRFEVAGEGQAGYRVDMTSIVIESRP